MHAPPVFFHALQTDIQIDEDHAEDRGTAGAFHLEEKEKQKGQKALDAPPQPLDGEMLRHPVAITVQMIVTLLKNGQRVVQIIQLQGNQAKDLQSQHHKASSRNWRTSFAKRKP